jgi:hypothetical protein
MSETKWYDEYPLTTDQLMRGEFDGDPATGFCFSLMFWLPDGKGALPVFRIMPCDIAGGYLEWNPPLLWELYRRANRKHEWLEV